MTRQVVLAIAALLAVVVQAQAQVNELRHVPRSLADQDRLRLFEIYTPLAFRRARLYADAERYNSDCPRRAANSGCASRRAELDARRDTFNADADDYNARALSLLEDRVDSLRAGLASDVRAIENLRLHRTAAEFEDWTTFALDADERKWQQLDAALRDTVQAIALGTLEGVAEKLATNLLAPKLIYVKTAQATIRKLKAAGISDPALSSAILSLSSNDARIRRRMAHTVIRRLGELKSAWLLSDAGPDRESAQWQAGAAAIGLIGPTPQLQVIGRLTLQGVRVLFYSGAVHVDKAIAEYKVATLSEMTDRQLQDLNRLIARMNETGKRLHAARAELEADGASR